ncbi:g300 [Coccomyxa viridis]|uniref:Purple acid phosphatase n=1 Tax=Coccomyxa viridis TaxID=1274662 RepID=A0ABP1FFE2_9CHLO
MVPEYLFILLAALWAASGAVIPLSTDITTPYTHPWDTSLRPATDFLPLTTGIAADNTTGNEPSQIHLTIAGPNAISVNWATGQAKTGKGNLQPNDAFGTPSVVKYGLSASNLNMTATGTAQVYSQIYNASYAFWGGNSTLNYTSPVLHTVVLPDLTPNTAYYYSVGDGTTFGSTLMFHSLKAAGPSYPQRLILLADWGLSHNSSTTLDHAVKSALQSTSPPCILYIADFCYADTWFPNGTVSSPNTAVEGNPNAGSYQPVWDAWQRFVQPLVGQVPMVGGTGNHEEEQEADGTIFKAVQARWPTPYRASGSPSYFFYSVNVGPSHNIFLSNYIDYTVGSQQYIWLKADLANINRTLTPWVTVNFHNPWYTTDTSYKEFEQMQIAMEPLTIAAGVDVFFYGHVHAYERTAPVNNYTVDPCGTVHITIGDAGNSEGISFLDNFQDPMLQFEDLNGGCPNVNASQPRPSYLLPLNPNKDPWSWYQRTLTFQADGNSTGVGNPPGYCYKEQPAWSLYRESSFGHGTLDLINGTHALWSWHANQDSNAVARDSVYIVRNSTACPNKMSGSATAPAPSANPLGQLVMSASSGG